VAWVYGGAELPWLTDQTCQSRASGESKDDTFMLF
jgi:hypothetical protein